METRKLELADIVSYLPYGLKVLYYGASEDDDTQWEVRGLHHNYGIETLTGNGSVWCLPIDKCKPILRPMSDLTKPMTHPCVNGGEEFVPLIFLIKEITNHDVSLINEWNLYDDHIWVHYEYDGGKKESCLINFFIYALPLFNQLHFDYNDLVGQCLAIDINATTL